MKRACLTVCEVEFGIRGTVGGGGGGVIMRLEGKEKGEENDCVEKDEREGKNE